MKVLQILLLSTIKVSQIQILCYIKVSQIQILCTIKVSQIQILCTNKVFRTMQSYYIIYNYCPMQSRGYNAFLLT